MQSTASQDVHFPLGAHVVTPRRWYTHHGIYVGAGQVVHYQGLSSSMRCGPVAKVSLAEFAHGQPVRMHGETDVAYSGMEVVARACSRLGEDAYDVLRNNCEHFCSWCLIGAARSPQVERLLSSPRAVALAARVLAVLVSGWSTAREALPLIS
ncbi:lecithin retinol acyltransferase family protein [Variovorax sp. DT-64]|uniref:lecithin retinol acyltransferase family protein n=1 Tax=Variovorax sp. DT-64 TaxID=3396160 RepID=UPI003F195209